MTYRLRRARMRGISFPNYLRLGVYAVILILTPLDAQTSRDGSLYTLVANIKGAMPTSGSNGYVEPTAERITAFPASQLPGGCTIGVAAGTATSDGRPMVWKTRDYIDKPNNEVDYNTSYKYKFIAVINAGESYVRMGVNEKGFAIVNSSAYDLPLPEGSEGPGNGLTMRHALGICATVAEFEHFLDSTNVTGRITRGNLAVLDSTGAAAMFEGGGNVYWKYDAADTVVAPHGYVLRTNFAVNGDGSGSGLERYARQQTLVGEYHAGDSLNYRSIIRHQMRDFSDFDGNPVSVPYTEQWLPERPFGYIYTGVSICRYKSVSAAVIQGVLPGEFAGLSTMWTMLGQPASSITVPYWPVGNTPEEASGNPTAPLCDVANQIKALLFDYATNSYYIDSYKLRDGSGGGLWTQTFPVEDSIFSAAETLLVQWRTDTLLVNEMLAAETAYAEYALSILQQAYTELAASVPIVVVETGVNAFALEQNYPNPFNARTTFSFRLPVASETRITIYDLLGREVVCLEEGPMEPGYHQQVWDGRDARGRQVPSGIYIARLGTPEFRKSIKLVLLK